MEKIFISLAGYRDEDIRNTAKDLYDKADNKESLFFSIVSHEDEDMILDFSFLSDEQYSYKKIDYRIATGVCSARHMANSLLSDKYKYFFQTDAHSRVVVSWDTTMINLYKKCSVKWGEDYLFTKYPHGFLFNWDLGDYVAEINYDNHLLQKTYPVWDQYDTVWKLSSEDLVDKEYGDEVYTYAANCVFGSAKSMMKIPYDPYIMFFGEEITLGVRAFVNDIPLVSPPINFLWTNYDRKNGGRKGTLWSDNDKWEIIGHESKKRIDSFFHCKDLGVYGISNVDKYRELQSILSLDMESPNYFSREI
jgi:hypothetical protein